MEKTIKTEADIDGVAAKVVRKKLGLNQRVFWSAVGVSQAAGCRFETGRGEHITPSVRILLFARYWAGLEVDASTTAGVKKLRQLAKLQKAQAKTEPPAA